MSMRIDGTNTAANPGITGTDADTGLQFGTNEVSIVTGGTEKVKVDSSGDVGMGLTTPASKLHVKGGSLTVEHNSASTGTGQLNINSESNSQATFSYDDEGHISFGTATAPATQAGFSERMRVASDGKIRIGMGNFAADPSATNAGAQIHNINSGTFMSSSGTITTAVSHGIFINGNGLVGSISSSGSATAFNTSSDYRLKENVVNITNGITRVKQLLPKRFNFIADADTKVDGFLAHEAQAVVPEAVTGEKDATKEEEYVVTPAVLDDDGEQVTPAVMGTRTVPDHQGIDQSKLIPILTAALQEAITKIETLETQNASLEARLTALEGGAS